MASRCLNRATLIGNLTRDPELRYTPSGMAVCSFGVATNRSWTTKTGERKEDAQFHRIVAWNKLAELCSQLLAKGRRVFVEGRIQYREFDDSEGNHKYVTEIVISDMVVLDNKGTNNSDSDFNNSDSESKSDDSDLDDDGGVIDESAMEDIVIPDSLDDDDKDDKKESKKSTEKTEEKKEEVKDEMPF